MCHLIPFVPVPTPVNSNILQSYLAGYDQAEIDFLIAGFSHGFRIPTLGEPTRSICRNHASALENRNIVDEKIRNEVEAGRILGPYVSTPHDFVCSPLALVPKKNTGSFRLIHDLSFPKNKPVNSVNSVIAKENTQVSYDSIDTVVQKVKENGRACLMAKTDIANAFRIVPIHQDDRHLLGFAWKNSMGVLQYYMDACLAMGLSISCQTFERFSTALQWVMECKYGATMSHILDDFFFVGPAGSSLCHRSLSTFLNICADIGVPIKQEKTTSPDTCLTIYGIEVDSIAMITRLPQDKIEKIRYELDIVHNRKKVTLKQLQSLLGLLNFATLCVIPGRTFLRRLYDLTLGVTCPSHSIRLNNDARADLVMWQNFMRHFNGRCMFLHDDWMEADTFQLYTDAASTRGFAGVLGSQWFAEEWPLDFKIFHINILELFPIVVALEMWGAKMSNHKIVFVSDNEATVYILNKLTSKDPIMMKLVRRLVLCAMKHNILFRCRHLSGRLNTLADSLSRFKFQEAFLLGPHLAQMPVPVPRELMKI